MAENSSLYSRQSSEIDRMAVRVKEVMPQVPVAVIRKDLLITTNVDETINRLLDGTTSYEPETNAVPVNESAKDISRANSVNGELGYNTSAKTFGKSAAERMQSYTERRTALIEAARNRYLRKHPNVLQ